MEQIEQLKAMRDAARARVEASVDYQVANRLDAMISDLEAVFGGAAPAAPAPESDAGDSETPPADDDEFEIAAAEAEAETFGRTIPAEPAPVTPFPAQQSAEPPTASDAMSGSSDIDDGDIVASALEDLSLDADDSPDSRSEPRPFSRPGFASGTR